MFGLVCGQAGQGKAGLGSSLDGFRSCSSSKRAASAASAGISSAKACSAGAFFSWGVSRRRLSHRRPSPLAATVAELKVELQNRQLPKTGRKKDLEKRLELAQSIEKMTVKQLKTQLTEQGPRLIVFFIFLARKSQDPQTLSPTESELRAQVCPRQA